MSVFLPRCLWTQQQKVVREDKTGERQSLMFYRVAKVMAKTKDYELANQLSQGINLRFPYASL